MSKIASGIALFACFLTSCNGTSPPTPPPLTPVTVYGGDADYEAFTEPESPWYGTLQEVTEGSFSLVYGDDQRALYTRAGETRLRSFIDHKVIVTGKLAGTEEGARLWPAVIEVHTDGLLACSKLISQVPVEEKLTQQHLQDLLAERPAEQIEPISISFCDDQTITPESTRAQLERLRASAFAMLRAELAPYSVSVWRTSWLTGGLSVDMPLGKVREVAERADVMDMSALNAPQLPPP